MKVTAPLDEYLTQGIGQWAEQLVQRIRVEMHNQGLDASGNLSSSLEWEIEGDEVKILADDYFLYAEGGRTPGRIPYNFTTILEVWLRNKGIVRPATFKTDRAFASAIAYKIKNYGSSKYRGDRPKDDVLSAPMDEMLPKLNEIIENRMVMYINETLFE